MRANAALLFALVAAAVRTTDGVVADRVEHCDNMGNESPFICAFANGMVPEGGYAYDDDGDDDGDIYNYDHDDYNTNDGYDGTINETEWVEQCMTKVAPTAFFFNERFEKVKSSVRDCAVTMTSSSFCDPSFEDYKNMESGYATRTYIGNVSKLVPCPNNTCTHDECCLPVSHQCLEFPYKNETRWPFATVDVCTGGGKVWTEATILGVDQARPLASANTRAKDIARAFDFSDCEGKRTGDSCTVGCSKAALTVKEGRPIVLACDAAGLMHMVDPVTRQESKQELFTSEEDAAAQDCIDMHTKSWALNQPDLYAYYRFAPDKPGVNGGAGTKAYLQLDESGNGNDATLVSSQSTGSSGWKVLGGSAEETYTGDCKGGRFGFWRDTDEYKENYFGRAVAAKENLYVKPSVTVGGGLRMQQFEQHDTQVSYLVTITDGKENTAGTEGASERGGLRGYALAVGYNSEGPDASKIYFSYFGPTSGPDKHFSQVLTEAWNFTPEPDAVWQTVELTVDFKTGVMTATVNGVVASFNTSDPWPSTAWRDGVFCALAPKSDSPDGYDDRKDIHSMYILEGPSVGRYPFAEACTGVDLPYAGCDPAATAATSGKPTYTALDKPISETGPTCENVGLVTVSDEKECQAAAVANGKLFELMRIDEYQESIRPFGCHANTYESRVDVVVNNVSRTWFFNRQNDSTVVNEDIARLVCKSSVASKAASSSDNRVLLSEFEEHPFFGTICSVSGKVKSNSLKKKRTGACITDADCPCTAVCVPWDSRQTSLDFTSGGGEGSGGVGSGAGGVDTPAECWDHWSTEPLVDGDPSLLREEYIGLEEYGNWCYMPGSAAIADAVARDTSRMFSKASGVWEECSTMFDQKPQPGEFTFSASARMNETNCERLDWKVSDLCTSGPTGSFVVGFPTRSAGKREIMPPRNLMMPSMRAGEFIENPHSTRTKVQYTAMQCKEAVMAKMRMWNAPKIYGWSVNEKVISGHPMVQGPCYFFTEPITEYYADSVVERAEDVRLLEGIEVTCELPAQTATPAARCREDEHVVDNACTACPEGTTRSAGDDASSINTDCESNDESSAYQQQFVKAAKKFCSTGYTRTFLVGAPAGFDSLVLDKKGGNPTASDATVLAPSAGLKSMTPYECKTAVEDVIALTGVEVFAWTTELTGGPCVYYTKQLNYSSTSQFDLEHFSTNPNYPKYLATCEMDANVGASWCTTGRHRRFYQGYPSGDHVKEMDCNGCRTVQDCIAEVAKWEAGPEQVYGWAIENSVFSNAQASCYLYTHAPYYTAFDDSCTIERQCTEEYYDSYIYESNGYMSCELDRNVPDLDSVSKELCTTGTTRRFEFGKPNFYTVTSHKISLHDAGGDDKLDACNVQQYVMLDQPTQHSGATCEDYTGALPAPVTGQDRILATIAAEDECRAAAKANGKQFELMVACKDRPHGCHSTNSNLGTWYFNPLEGTNDQDILDRLVCKACSCGSNCTDGTSTPTATNSSGRPFGLLCKEAVHAVIETGNVIVYGWALNQRDLMEGLSEDAAQAPECWYFVESFATSGTNNDAAGFPARSGAVSAITDVPWYAYCEFDVNVEAQAASSASNQPTKIIIGFDDAWKYYLADKAPPVPSNGGGGGMHWRMLSYVDAAWASGQGPFGAGVSDDDNIYEERIKQEYVSDRGKVVDRDSVWWVNTVASSPKPAMNVTTDVLYLRKTVSFNADNVDSCTTSFRLRLFCDDGCIVWINSQEVARLGMAAQPDPLPVTESAADAAAALHAIRADENVPHEYFDFVVPATLIGGVEGVKQIAAQVHPHAQTKDLRFSLALRPASCSDVQPVIQRGADWHFWDKNSRLPCSWADPAFNHTEWGSGPAQLGYGDGDEATVINWSTDAAAKGGRTRRVDVACMNGGKALTPALYAEGYEKYKDAGCIPAYAFCQPANPELYTKECAGGLAFKGDIDLTQGPLLNLTHIEDRAFYQFRGKLEIDCEMPALKEIGNAVFQSNPTTAAGWQALSKVVINSAGALERLGSEAFDLFGGNLQFVGAFPALTKVGSYAFRAAGAKGSQINVWCRGDTWEVDTAPFGVGNENQAAVLESRIKCSAFVATTTTASSTTTTTSSTTKTATPTPLAPTAETCLATKTNRTFCGVGKVHDDAADGVECAADVCKSPDDIDACCLVPDKTFCPGGWRQGDPSQLANVDYHYVVDGASMNLAECVDVADYYIDVLKLPVFAWAHWDGIKAVQKPFEKTDYCKVFFGSAGGEVPNEDFGGSFRYPDEVVDPAGSSDLYCLVDRERFAPASSTEAFHNLLVADEDGTFESLCPTGYAIRHRRPSVSYLPEQITPAECAAAAAAAAAAKETPASAASTDSHGGLSQGWAVKLSALMAPMTFDTAPAKAPKGGSAGNWAHRKAWCYLFDGDDESFAASWLEANGDGLETAGFWCLPVAPHPTCRTTEEVGLAGTANPSRQCVFPFRYNGKVFHGCTEYNNNGIPWCGTTFDVDMVPEGWGLCDVSTCVSAPDYRHPDGENCAAMVSYCSDHGNDNGTQADGRSANEACCECGAGWCPSDTTHTTPPSDGGGPPPGGTETVENVRTCTDDFQCVTMACKDADCCAEASNAACDDGYSLHFVKASLQGLPDCDEEHGHTCCVLRTPDDDDSSSSCRNPDGSIDNSAAGSAAVGVTATASDCSIACTRYDYCELWVWHTDTYPLPAQRGLCFIKWDLSFSFAMPEGSTISGGKDCVGDDIPSNDGDDDDDGDEKIITAYFRHVVARTDTFDADCVAHYLFRVVVDDGAVVYGNGEELFRINMDPQPSQVNYRTGALTNAEYEIVYREHWIPAAMVGNSSNGSLLVAAEVHQYDSTSSDLSFQLELIPTMKDGCMWTPTTESATSATATAPSMNRTSANANGSNLNTSAVNSTADASRMLSLIEQGRRTAAALGALAILIILGCISAFMNCRGAREKEMPAGNEVVSGSHLGVKGNVKGFLSFGIFPAIYLLVSIFAFIYEIIELYMFGIWITVDWENAMVAIVMIQYILMVAPSLVYGFHGLDFVESKQLWNHGGWPGKVTILLIPLASLLSLFATAVVAGGKFGLATLDHVVNGPPTAMLSTINVDNGIVRSSTTTASGRNGGGTLRRGSAVTYTTDTNAGVHSGGTADCIRSKLPNAVLWCIGVPVAIFAAILGMVVVCLLPMLWGAAIQFKLYLLTPCLYEGLEYLFGWAVVGAPAARFDALYLNGDRNKAPKVHTLFHPGDPIDTWEAHAASANYTHPDSGGGGNGDVPGSIDPAAKAKQTFHITARNAAFLMTFSLLVEFTLGGLANIIVTVANNELGAGWCQGCCEYTQGSFAVTCIMFTVNLWAIIKMLYQPPHHIFNPAIFYRDEAKPRKSRPSLMWLGGDGEEGASANGIFSLDSMLKPLPHRGLPAASALASTNAFVLETSLASDAASRVEDENAATATAAVDATPDAAAVAAADDDDDVYAAGVPESAANVFSLDELASSPSSAAVSSGGALAVPVVGAAPVPRIRIAPPTSPRRSQSLSSPERTTSQPPTPPTPTPPTPTLRRQTQPASPHRPQKEDGEAAAGVDVVPAEMLQVDRSKQASTLPGRLSGDLLMQFNRRYDNNEAGIKAGKEKEKYKNELKAAADGHAFVLAKPLRPSQGRRGRRSSMDVSLLTFESDV